VELRLGCDELVVDNYRRKKKEETNL
jgi:hypothetical protein